LDRFKRHRSDAESQPVRLFLAVVLLVVVAVCFVEGRRELTLDHKLSAIAGEIAGRHVNVDCPGFLRGLIDISGNGGSVYFDANGNPSNTTRLETSVCRSLAHYGDTRKSADFACVYGTTRCSEKIEKAVYAAVVLSHESQHLRGIRSESTTQCYAVQMVPLVAERLGSPPAEAKAVAAHYLAVQQPYMPPDYALTRDCVDGGSLDLHPDSTGWPGG
jgi:hypothetical protein